MPGGYNRPMATPPRTRPWLVLTGLAPGLFLAMADATIMTIVIPELIQRFNTSVTTVSWVMNGYNLVLAVLFLPLGRVADRFGRKLVFTLGLAVFTAASLGCALSPTIRWLIVFRCVQGVGAAGVIPASLAILMAAFPGHRQGFASGLFGGVSSLAAAAGPALGGFLIMREWQSTAIHLHHSWQLIFFFNVPVGLLGIGLVLALVPRRGRVTSAAAIDVPGVLLSSMGLFCLTLALIQGNAWGWRSLPILGLFVVAAALLGAFVAWELHVRTPLFDLRLLERRPFGAASVAIMTVDVAFMGTAFMLVIYMVALMDYTYLRAAVAITVLPLAGLILAPLAGRTVDRIGPRWPAVAGATLSAAGLIALAHLSRTASLGDVMWRTALVGVGFGLTLPALMAAGMTSLPVEVRGTGSGWLNTCRQLGFLLGVAILVAVFGVTMQHAVTSAGREARAATATAPFLSAQSRSQVDGAIASVEKVGATADMERIREVAHPLADVIQPTGIAEAASLLSLKDQLEKLYLDKVAMAFRAPLYVAAFAALLALPAAFLLGRRLTPAPPPA